MTDVCQIAHVVAEGDPFDLGSAHGAVLAAPLRAFLDDGLARLHHLLPTPVTLAGLAPTLTAYRDRIAEETPALAQEIRGLAAGADLSLDEATLLQLRRELMGYHKIPTCGDCTTYARPGLLAQTVDLNGNLDEHVAVLELGRNGRRALILSFAGLLGYLGVNSAGLAVGLNLVLAGDWRPGLPPYLAIRHLLDVASTVGEAVRVLRGLRLASSRSVMLADPQTTAWVEVVGDEYRVRKGTESVHTNHFLDEEFARRDELNVFARNSSLRRLEAATAGLRQLGPDATPDEHFALLAQPPICVPDEGNIRRERTVAAIVALPAEGQLHVRPGDPSRSKTTVYTL